MLFLVVLLLGLVQGASEFLPISSSGHLVVLYQIFNITENTIFLSIVLHLGTLLSIVVVYRKQLWKLIKNPFCKTNLLLLCATISTIIVVLLFKNAITSLFNGRHIEWFFLITAGILLLAHFFGGKQQTLILNNKNNKLNNNASNNTQQIRQLSNNSAVTKQVQSCAELSKSTKQQSYFVKDESTDLQNITNLNMPFWKAIVIGLMQGVATVPGISRSGMTISTALLLGVNLKDAPNFSFLLSIPIIVASLVFEIWGMQGATIATNFTALQLSVGFLVAFVVGWLCLRATIAFVRQRKLYVFSIYLILLWVVLLFV